jgi:hypothetical protein
MDRGRVGEDRGSKEMDGCPLTPFTRADLATSWRSSHVMMLHFEGGVM